MRNMLAELLKRKPEGDYPKEEFYPNGPWLISIDGPFVCETKKGERIEFDPKTIERIKIVTNDRGPFEEDVFWKFEYQGGHCYLASEADTNGSFLSYFQDLKGFNNEAVIQSMACANNAVFVAWDRDAL